MSIYTDMLSGTASQQMTLFMDSTVSYRNQAGTVRPGISAMIDYPDDQSGVPREYHPTGTPKILITVYNNVNTGISIEDDHPVIGGAIYVASAPNANAKWCTIRRRVKSSKEFVTFEVN